MYYLRYRSLFYIIGVSLQIAGVLIWMRKATLLLKFSSSNKVTIKYSISTFYLYQNYFLLVIITLLQ
jgi:hypothetical protein